MLGSVAEQIFRSASCLVLTVGPYSPKESDLSKPEAAGPLLFATDFSDTSLAALPYAISFATQRRTRLVSLHMFSPLPLVAGSRWYTAEDVMRMRKEAQLEACDRLQQLTSGVTMELPPLSIAEYGDAAEGILRNAERLRTEVIVMGLHRKNHIETVSHLPWSTAYKVVCGAVCPVLTVRTPTSRYIWLRHKQTLKYRT
jgi:nucleotide-binding universal stress UspA family protein